MKPKTEKRACAGVFMSLCFLKSAHAFFNARGGGNCFACWLTKNGYLESVGFILLGITVFALVIYLTKDEQ